MFIDAGGSILAKYRKTHLVTAAPLDERPVFTPGDAICELQLQQLPSRPHDLLRSSVPGSLPRPHIEHDANVFINSSAWPFPRLEHLRILALTRAIENQSYLIVANRVGSDDGVTFCGTSVIIDPYGVIVAAASADREELIQAEISQDVIDAVRKRMAVFEHRRQICIKNRQRFYNWRCHCAQSPRLATIIGAKTRRAARSFRRARCRLRGNGCWRDKNQRCDMAGNRPRH